jgi:hypothetical protein
MCLGVVIFAVDPPLATHHTQPGSSPSAKQGFLCVFGGEGLVLSFSSFLINFHFLTNQFTVKVPKKINRGGLYLLSWKHGNALGQRGWAKYCDSDNFKAVPRIFSGMKTAPLSSPKQFPRAAAPSGAN